MCIALIIFIISSSLLESVLGFFTPFSPHKLRGYPAGGQMCSAGPHGGCASPPWGGWGLKKRAKKKVCALVAPSQTISTENSLEITILKYQFSESTAGHDFGGMRVALI